MKKNNKKNTQQFHSAEELIEDIRRGKMVILVDDEDRENEGDIVLAADHVTSEAINFMATHAKGLICLAMSSEQMEQLGLPLMVKDEYNLTPNKTAFTVSIEAATGVTTGISAADRAHTIKVASRPSAKPRDIHMPGHIFPIKARKGGVLKRAGHTEGSVDLAILAGLNPSAVICEVMNSDGSMSRVRDLKKFAKKHRLKIGTIVDLIEYRLQREVLVEEIASFSMGARFDNFTAKVFRSLIDGSEHLVIQKGEIKSEKETLVRVQVDSKAKMILDSLSGRGVDLSESLNLIRQCEQGVFLLLSSPYSEISLIDQVKIMMSDQQKYEFDPRERGVGAQILRYLGVKNMVVITQGEQKKGALEGYQLHVTQTVVKKEHLKKSSTRVLLTQKIESNKKMKTRKSAAKKNR